MDQLINAHLIAQQTKAFDNLLIQAALKKGFELSEENAANFQIVEVGKNCVLIHIPSLTPICKYSMELDWDYDITKISVQLKIELM